MNCVYCHSRETHLSRRGNRFLFWPLHLFVRIVRCHECGERYYARGPLLLGPDLRFPENAADDSESEASDSSVV